VLIFDNQAAEAASGRRRDAIRGALPAPIVSDLASNVSTTTGRGRSLTRPDHRVNHQGQQIRVRLKRVARLLRRPRHRGLYHAQRQKSSSTMHSGQAISHNMMLLLNTA